jgi:hypothetical protein
MIARWKPQASNGCGPGTKVTISEDERFGLSVRIPRMQKILCSLLLAGAILTGSSCGGMKPTPSSAAIDSTKYYAVLLTNGSVYFGKLEGMGSLSPVLRDVFYIQQVPADPNTKQPAGMVLVHRGKELHAPDRMILTDKSIVFIEPVGADSRVAQLIKEAQK